ncbi:Cytochrome P450 714C3 [Hondaea fermentalgiana]|uniref:Cytochrome P450 714C3 n=1 Tax=Hondaea fermentalgiana TaxID=2315210 RepID=A0A2R5GK94_9STRA|nr:Cytochrome P450 714C3 [Hondaea fermentalgiana]|eukprot:GBG28701.1 Cytochrome P450 714C3 [Hondaea fermentalgiana]
MDAQKSPKQQHKDARMEDFAFKFQGRKLTWKEVPTVLPREGEYDISKHLAGPMREDKTWFQAQAELKPCLVRGTTHVKYAEWQRKYGGEQGLAANIVVPLLATGRENDVGKLQVPTRTMQVIVGNPKDAERLARYHVRKQGNFTTGLYSSIISTRDNESWRDQRETLVTAFLPRASLEQILPVSVARARACVDRLREVSENFTVPVDMNDFALYETQAQLQLALFGEDEEFMNRTNKAFRDSMSGKADSAFVRNFCKQVVERAKQPERTCPAHPDLIASGACPHVRGPLSNRLTELGGDKYQAVGNAVIFEFAGHDTTGHTLTWLLFELSKNPAYQQRLRDEVDEFWRTIGDREIRYDDLKMLKFMTRCVMETLRLWNAVPNGTFREVQFDDYITGPNGEEVLLKKGTFMQIVNWSRHRNPDLWGPDVDEFNPDREFKDAELWYDQGLAAYNPASDRFSPFTYPGRDCIGKNFAHMEMRLILANLLRNYEFALTEEYLEADAGTYLGVNYGTLAPQDLKSPPFVSSKAGWATFSKQVPTGMHFYVRPRTGKPRL